VGAPSASRWEIFAALAQGLEIPQILARFRMSREELQHLFREVAEYYREREVGFWRLYCDGAARGNPGPAGAGAVLHSPGGKQPVREGLYLGETTNNVAEYQALLLGLRLAQAHGAKKLKIFLDSQLLVEQLRGRYQVKSPHLLPLWRQAKEELQKLEAYAISHVERALNSQADLLARQAIDQRPPSS
jgi:ribonuclease HI